MEVLEVLVQESEKKQKLDSFPDAWYMVEGEVEDQKAENRRSPNITCTEVNSTITIIYSFLVN